MKHPSTIDPEQPPHIPEHAPHSQAGALAVILQLLSYALWSWMFIALSVVLSTALTFFLADQDNDYTFVIYALAALICLTPLAFFADRWFARHEPAQKPTFMSVIMVLSAVFTFLVALGSLITAVMIGLSMLVEATDLPDKAVGLIVSLNIAILGGMFFLRILHLSVTRAFSKLFPYLATGIALLAIVLVAVGPLRVQIMARDDKLIEENLPSLTTVIQSYANKNEKLPSKLSEVTFENYQSGAKTLVQRNMVEYKKISAKPTNDATDSLLKITDDPNTSSMGYLRYEICVSYSRAKNVNEATLADQQGAIYHNSADYIDTTSHKAGRVCYTQSPYTYTYSTRETQ